MPSLNSLAAYRRRGAEVEPPDQAPPDQAPSDQAPSDQAPRRSRRPSAAAAKSQTAGRQKTEDAESSRPRTGRRTVATASRRTTEDAESARARTGRRTVFTLVRARRISVLLGAVTVLLGGLAFWSANEAAGLRGGAQHNTALTDTVRTSEVKGKVADDVNTLFSYDYTDPAKNDQAARSTLTGKAVRQYDTMMATVRRQGAQQKLVLTTTVTYSAVETLDGDRARVLLFADQRDTRAVAKDTTYAAAMLAVDAEYRGGVWKITNIDTLNVPAQ